MHQRAEQRAEEIGSKRAPKAGFGLAVHRCLKNACDTGFSAAFTDTGHAVSPDWVILLLLDLGFPEKPNHGKLTSDFANSTPSAGAANNGHGTDS